MASFDQSTAEGRRRLFQYLKRQRSRQDLERYRLLIKTPLSFSTTLNFAARSRSRLGFRPTTGSVTAGQVTLNGESSPNVAQGAIYRFSNIPELSKPMVLTASVARGVELLVFDSIGNGFVIASQ